MSVRPGQAEEIALALRTRLQSMTPARVGLGLSGVSQKTRDVLSFQVSHARARDAVHAQLDGAALAANISSIKAAVTGLPVIRLHSAALDRGVYLQRPDLGRILNEPSRKALSSFASAPCDLALIAVDGLSSLAVERHFVPLLEELLPRVVGWRLAPFCIVEQGRVAVGDEIGFTLHARISVVLIGERPGLCSPDSMGAYITWDPRPGRIDAERNCISNIRAEGMSYKEAAEQLRKCLAAARRRQLTGVALTEDRRQLTKG